MTKRGIAMRPRLAGVLAVLMLTAGCGVGASAAPEDAGDALGASNQSGSAVSIPKPDQFANSVELVRGFLKASAGAGDAGVSQVTRFLNEKGRQSWTRPRPEAQNELTVIRVVDTRTEAQQGGRTPVVVDFQEVGTLATDRGRLTKLQDPTSKPRQMRFWVAPESETREELRIDEIEDAPDGLLISDEGLAEFYLTQPIYFWDDGYSALVPDLRYVMRGHSPEVRANRIVQWLIDGPSPMLGAVQRLRPGTATEGGVTEEKGVLSVKLKAQAGEGDARAIDRLLFQLQWSLRGDSSSAPAVSLQVGDDVRAAKPTDGAYLNFNQASWLESNTARAFDIKDEKVVALPSGSGPDSPVALLAAKENRNVVAAAISRDLHRAALVVRRNGTLALQIVREEEKTQLAPRLEASDMGRPSWIPGSQMVLVTAAGKIRAVSATTGKVSDLTPSRVGEVTSLSVSPDGRRIAFVADGRLYVAQLGVNANGAVVEPEPQLLLINTSLDAAGVAWTSTVSLGLVGKVGGTAVMYQLTSDGVIARRSDLPPGTEPTGIVASPVAGLPSGGLPTSVIVYVLTPQAAYSQGQAESSYRAPFFAS